METSLPGSRGRGRGLGGRRWTRVRSGVGGVGSEGAPRRPVVVLPTTVEGKVNSGSTWSDVTEGEARVCVPLLILSSDLLSPPENMQMCSAAGVFLMEEYKSPST